MKQDVKKLWVDALESGKYEQQMGSLRAGNRFCCLGVLCNLHAQAHPEIASKQYHDNLYMGRSANLPTEVMEWAGLTVDIGDPVCIGGWGSTLTGQNDVGRTFQEIAKAIKEQL